MDTEKLIEQFKATARYHGEQKQVYENAVGILEGTLATQALALEATYQSTIENLTEEKVTLETAVQEKQNEILAKEAEIEELKKPKSETLEEAVII